MGFYTSPDMAYAKIRSAAQGELVLLARNDADGIDVKASYDIDGVTIYVENEDGLMDEQNVIPDESEVADAVLDAYKWFNVVCDDSIDDLVGEFTPDEFDTEMLARENELDDLVYDLISSILIDYTISESSEIITDELIQEVKNTVLSIMGWKYKIPGIYRPVYIPVDGEMKPVLHPYDEYDKPPKK